MVKRKKTRQNRKKGRSFRIPTDMVGEITAQYKKTAVSFRIWIQLVRQNFNQKNQSHRAFFSPLGPEHHEMFVVMKQIRKADQQVSLIYL